MICISVRSRYLRRYKNKTSQRVCCLLCVCVCVDGDKVMPNILIFLEIKSFESQISVRHFEIDSAVE